MLLGTDLTRRVVWVIGERGQERVLYRLAVAETPGHVRGGDAPGDVTGQYPCWRQRHIDAGFSDRHAPHRREFAAQGGAWLDDQTRPGRGQRHRAHAAPEFRPCRGQHRQPRGSFDHVERFAGSDSLKWPRLGPE